MFFTQKNKKAVWFILGGLLGLNIFAWIIVYDLGESYNLEVIFFDVGQGDAIFIETSAGHQILIDGGPGFTILEKLAKEMPFYDRTIDLIILTHPEKDHLAGLLDVLKRYRIEHILWTGIIRDTAEWREWDNLIKREKGAEIKIAKSGQKIILGENPPIFINVLYPFENLEGKKIENSNDTSVVTILVGGNNSFLFTGDIDKSVERQLLDRGIDSGILKVAHHGSKYSTSEEFLTKASPKIAVIQVGENKYGHPHPEVLQKFYNFGIDFLTTKEKGDIIFKCPISNSQCQISFRN